MDVSLLIQQIADHLHMITKRGIVKGSGSFMTFLFSDADHSRALLYQPHHLLQITSSGSIMDRSHGQYDDGGGLVVCWLVSGCLS